MAIDPQEISLSVEQKRQLAELANRTGRPWPEVLAEAIESYRTHGGSAPSAGRGSLYDAMKDVIGIVRAAPADLSSNPIYMEGFGSDHDAGAR
jgi:hypothetical protein